MKVKGWLPTRARPGHHQVSHRCRQRSLSSVVLLRRRITSYNVCYTKLLRNKTNQDEHLDIFTQNKGGYKLYLKLKGELGNVINDFAYIFRKLQETGYIIGHIEYYYFQEWLKKEFGIDHIGKKYHTLSGLHTIAKDKICNPIIEEHTKINSIQ